MRFCATFISTLLCASIGAQARLGSLRTLNSINDTEDCAQGYTCWKDNGSLWAKADGVASGMDCDSVCFAAFAKSSAFHTCKKGVSSPSSASDLAAVAMGLNFDCSGSQAHPNQCWEGKSPPTLDGIILVTGDDQVSKNCYFPSEEVLSCDVPLDGANCYGELFSAVCPCTAEEEHQITASKKWRLYTNGDYPKTGPKWSWNLNNIFLYPSDDCTGTPLNTSNGATFTDSGNAGSGWWSPEKAFGDNPGQWGGRWDDNIDKNLWISVEFPTTVNVGCVQFDQSDNYAQYIKLEALSSGSTTWQTVREVSNGIAGTNTIQV